MPALHLVCVPPLLGRLPSHHLALVKREAIERGQAPILLRHRAGAPCVSPCCAHCCQRVRALVCCIASTPAARRGVVQVRIRLCISQAADGLVQPRRQDELFALHDKVLEPSATNCG